tara:strand:- start:70 stop:1266 length:1197 start_codon:yes stop_codon:yes gene_type:complete
MGIYRGPNNVTKDLEFGFDIGHGVGDNVTGTRFAPGEPTTNMVSSVQHGAGQLLAVQSVSVAYVGEEDGWSKYSLNGSWTAGTYPYSMRVGSAVFAAGVKYSTQCKIKTNCIEKFHYFASNGLSYVNVAMDHNGVNSSTLLDEGCYLLKREGFAYTTATTQPGYLWTRGNSETFSSSTDFVYIKDFMVERKDHCSPWTATSRSDTASLIDLKRSTDIDVGGISFSTTAQAEFDGSDDKITLSHANSPVTNVSYEMVVKFDSLPATNSYKSIWQKQTNWNDAGGVMMQFIYNSFRWSYGNSWGGAVSHAQSNFTTGKYYHIVGTVDNVNGENAKLYVDGVQVGSTGAGAKLNTTAVLNIGEGNGGRLDGSLGVFKMYSNTLTAEDVKQNYNSYKNRFNI